LRVSHLLLAVEEKHSQSGELDILHFPVREEAGIIEHTYGRQRGSWMNNIGSLMSAEKMAEFCKRWKIDELALFGSALNEGFKSDSDVDILVSFAPDADWS